MRKQTQNINFRDMLREKEKVNFGSTHREICHNPLLVIVGLGYKGMKITILTFVEFDVLQFSYLKFLCDN